MKICPNCGDSRTVEYFFADTEESAFWVCVMCDYEFDVEEDVGE